MKRDTMISKIATPNKTWDIVIVGGGATGVGTALEAASRGYEVVLIEQSDFGKATSSRSTKLAHGGVRYLQQGNVSLVLDALKERGIMRRNAPHLVQDLPFIVPVYDWWEGPFYGVGLKIYDMLAGKEGFGSSKNISKEETLKLIPTVETKGLRGGVIYHDGQFNDSRLLINIVQTAVEQGATILNYVKALSLTKEKDKLTGLITQDMETGEKYTIRAKAIINATGVFSDALRRLDNINAEEIMTSSQGIHLVLDKSFLPGNSGIMVPHTEDGRVLFAVPWRNRTLIGTTDTFVDKYPIEPIPLKSEITFLLEHASRYLTKDPDKSDIKSVFAGLRPLVSKTNNNGDTASISRDHSITISKSGMISIAGGKWTTYRKMGEDVINEAIEHNGLTPHDSITSTLQIHGYSNHSNNYGELSHYGSDAIRIKELLSEKKEYGKLLHPEHKIMVGEIIWAIRNEMVINIEDFLARRTQLLLLDAKSSIESATVVAKYMAKELGHGWRWKNKQVKQYIEMANNYLPK